MVAAYDNSNCYYRPYDSHLSVTWDQMYGNEPTAGLSATSDPSLILGGTVRLFPTI